MSRPRRRKPYGRWVSKSWMSACVAGSRTSIKEPTTNSILSSARRVMAVGWWGERGQVGLRGGREGLRARHQTHRPFATARESLVSQRVYPTSGPPRRGESVCVWLRIFVCCLGQVGPHSMSLTFLSRMYVSDLPLPYTLPAPTPHPSRSERAPDPARGARLQRPLHAGKRPLQQHPDAASARSEAGCWKSGDEAAWAGVEGW